MDPELQDNEYEIGGLVFGNDDRTRDLFVETLDLGAAEWVTQDRDNPVGDGTRPGRDFLRGPAWLFKLVIDQDTATDALAVYQRLAAIWRDRSVARTPGATRVLRYRRNGLTRRVYGRPRNFAITDRSQMDSGIIEVTAEFKQHDVLHYDDLEETILVRVGAGNTGGLVSPLVGPLTTLGTDVRAGLVTISGTGVTPVRVVFTGPFTNPVVRGDGWKVGVRGTVPYDRPVEVDSRTGTVRRDGANIAGALTYDTYLPDVRLQPGPQEIILEGTDPTGTATAELFWRNASDGF